MIVSKKVKLILQIASIFLGLIYLISGVIKVIDISSFYATISEYGFKKAAAFAPIIVIIEISIAIAFILHIKIRKTALLSSIALIFFTLLFTYAHIFKSVEDCGCFGSLGKDLSPRWLYVRNSIMLAISITIYFYYPAESKVKEYKKQVFFFIILITAYLSGFTYKNSINIFKTKRINKTTFIGKNIKDTPLKLYVPDTNDSIYMMYFFSYTCPHCLNSMENIKQYAKSRYVENVILIGLGNETSKFEFYNNFDLAFINYDIKKKEMEKITLKYPITYFIVNDTIRRSLTGTLPVHQVLRKNNFLD